MRLIHARVPQSKFPALFCCSSACCIDPANAAEMLEWAGGNMTPFTLGDLKRARILCLHARLLKIDNTFWQGGYTALDLLAGGVKARQITSEGFGLWSASDLLEAGYAMSEVNGECQNEGGSSHGKSVAACNADVFMSSSQTAAQLELPHSSNNDSDYIALQFDRKRM
jgi:hypothetical protein